MKLINHSTATLLRITVFGCVVFACGAIVTPRLSANVTMRLIGHYDTSGRAGRVVLSGQFAYLSDTSIGFHILDVSAPADPRWAGAYFADAPVAITAVSEGYAYVLTSFGLEIIDVSDPAAPHRVGGYSPGVGLSCSLAVQEGFAYLAVDHFGIEVINLSDLTAPRRVGDFHPSLPDPNPGRVVVYGDRLYFNVFYTDFFHMNVYTLDITSPPSPGIIETEAYQFPGHMVFSGHYLGVSRWVNYDETRVQIRDLDTGQMGEYNSGSIGAMSIGGNLAFFSRVGAGLLILDISNLSAPALADVKPDIVGSPVFHNGYLYVATNAGLDVYCVDDACPDCLPGDVTGDGVVNSLDTLLFAGLLLHPSTAGPNAACAADANRDGVIDGRDIDPFIQTLLGGP